MTSIVLNADADLTLIPEQAVVDADPQQRFGIVVDATEVWTWTADVDWIVSDDDDGSAAFWYTVAANPETSLRTGQIEFRSGEAVRVFSVIQKGQASVPFGVTEVTLASDGLLTLRWKSTADEKFAIEMSDPLISGNWVDLPGGPIVAEGADSSYTFPKENFAKAGWYRVRKGFPNLVADSIRVSRESVRPAETFTVTWNLANTGDADAPSTVTRIQLNQTSTITGGYETGEVEAPPVEAGRVVEQSVDITVPDGALPGDHYVWIIVDRRNTLVKVHEIDDNSRRSESVIVTQG
ncbi:MAG: hypothetical protein KDN22_06675 [Verrucomicrobiae bacterium]|nr:hypothetical protein [Verrucomicrobiae bacterium]